MDHAKTPGSIAPEDVEARLAQAQLHLEAFEATATPADLLARLRAASGLHPLLVVRSTAVVAAAGFVVATLASLAVPLFDRGLAQDMVQLEATSGLPMPAALAILTVCSAAVLFAAHFAAMAAGRNAPFLPHEAKVHQRLVSELRQIQAQKAVKERMTPAGQGPRVLAR